MTAMTLEAPEVAFEPPSGPIQPRPSRDKLDTVDSHSGDNGFDDFGDNGFDDFGVDDLPR